MEGEAAKQAQVVYIVDDDASVRKALSRLIRSLGIRTEVFASPQKFLERAVDEQIACLLLDVQLPGMDGFELRERTLEAGLDSPVIFITGHPDNRSRSRASAAGAVAYLEKPFDDQMLIEALEIALDRAVGGNDTPGRP
jgi:FixJ family two-component response regulator